VCRRKDRAHGVGNRDPGLSSSAAAQSPCPCAVRRRSGMAHFHGCLGLQAGREFGSV
jgi:hypothetical protein